jgi:outer membrane protein assembly factor BamA
VDTRDNSGNPKRGLFVTAVGAVYPPVWDVDSTFGEVSGAASVYLTANIPTAPTLALRAGGQKVWGKVPFLEAAYLGGGTTLRGYRSRRFAGNASVYGNAELRLSITPFRILVPGSFGLFALTDVGRVFYEGDPADANTWHVGYGGGFWISVIDRLQTLTVAVAKGDDLTGIYIRSGFMY